MTEKKRIVSDALWEQIRQHVPARENTHPRGGGRKPKDDRIVYEAILFVLRYGCQWSALDAIGLCPSSTVHDRFQKWLAAGFFHRLWDERLLDREMARDIDWSWLFTDEGRAATTARAGKARRKPGTMWGDKSGKNPVADSRHLAGKE